MEVLEIGGAGSELCIRVRVKPRASRTRVLGVRTGVLEVAVAAPPVDGAANEELVELLASVLDLGSRSVEIVSGVGARTKLVRIRGLSGAELMSRLSGGQARR